VYGSWSRSVRFQRNHVTKSMKMTANYLTSLEWPTSRSSSRPSKVRACAMRSAFVRRYPSLNLCGLCCSLQGSGCNVSVRNWGQLLHINLQRFRGGPVFKAHRLVYHSTLGLRGIKRGKHAPVRGHDGRPGADDVDAQVRELAHFHRVVRHQLHLRQTLF